MGAVASTYLRQGLSLRSQGKRDEAAKCFEDAIRLDPHDAEAHFQLALMHTELGRPSEALESARTAARIQPDHLRALNIIGCLLGFLNRSEEGVPIFQKALALEPANAEVLTNYGSILTTLGRLEEARAHYLRALEIKPDYAQAYSCLARDAQHEFHETDTRAIKALLAREGLSDRDRFKLNYTLAQILDRSGAHDEAFRYCAAANAVKAQILRQRGKAFSADEHTRYVDRLIEIFDGDHFVRTRSYGDDSALPVFIVGMPRSGTTLVEQILASHPAVHGGGETLLLDHLIDGLPAEFGGASYPECLATLDREASRRLAHTYLEGLRERRPDAERIINKVPTNFLHLGLVATLLPHARIFHCRRDARDVCLSCHMQDFFDFPASCDLGILGRYHRDYERTMAHWRTVLPIPILEVSYEQLVEAPERISREIVEFCGLSWDPACLRFHENQRAVYSSSATQVRRPIYKTSIGRWKNYEAHLHPLLEALSVPLSSC
jgi:tetratricopeptide (TPR) repeat protein